MKYKVSCYNGGAIFGLDLVFIKPDDVVVVVDARTEQQAIFEAKQVVSRDFYKVIEIVDGG